MFHVNVSPLVTTWKRILYHERHLLVYPFIGNVQITSHPQDYLIKNLGRGISQEIWAKSQVSVHKLHHAVCEPSPKRLLPGQAKEYIAI